MLQNMEAALFDLDGVLVDTAKYHFRAWKQLASERGIDFTEEQNEGLKGVGRMESLERILAMANMVLDADEKEMLAAKKNEHYLELISGMDKSELLDGVPRFFEILKRKNIKICLGSSSKNAAFILERVGLLPFFDAVIDGTKISRSKPHPEVFLLGAQALAVEPKDCVVFEDAPAGVEAGKRGGMYVVGIGQPRILAEADIVLSGIADLVFAT